MKTSHCTLSLIALLAAAHSPLRAEDAPEKFTYDSAASRGSSATDFAAAEKDLASASQAARPEEAVIETSHPYLLPRLFTLPTAYSLQSYEVRFGGQGNIHQTLANMNTDGLKGSISVGLGGIMELGYQLDEYYTVEDIADKILMGYFKLSLLKESKYLPAFSISASKNLRSGFHAHESFDYQMDEDMYEVVFSKAFHVGDNVVSLHPGAQIIRDQVTAVNQLPAFAEPYRVTKFNPRLGISWQSRPKTLFMYELKILHPTEVASFGAGDIDTHTAMENNLGIRYYLRNWLCIDSGIRHYYDLQNHTDEMKLHANFVGVIPMASVWDRMQGYFKK
jgi:hypothetical protein